VSSESALAKIAELEVRPVMQKPLSYLHPLTGRLHSIRRHYESVCALISEFLFFMLCSFCLRLYGRAWRNVVKLRDRKGGNIGWTKRGIIYADVCLKL
jgi:hypothetical protein